jgi:hypothetical protein
MITYEYLIKHYDYDKELGILIHKTKKKGRYGAVGSKVGSLHHTGYVTVRIKGKQYQAHRLIWMFCNGAMPKGEIDHINHIKSDNRIENLRDVSLRENSLNQSVRSDNTSGTVGVFWYKANKRWLAKIQIDGDYKYLGSFVNYSDAVNARKNAEVLYGFHENHGKDL